MEVTVDGGQVVIVITNILLVLGAVWKISALLQSIKSELVHLGGKVNGVETRVTKLESK